MYKVMVGESYDPRFAVVALEMQYRDALKTLRDLRDLRDYTPAGDKAFLQARDNVYWAKAALVLFESKL
jgi:hypothetical protein